MTNWYTEPTAPLKLVGEISAKYIGVIPALRPALRPVKNLDIMINSIELVGFAVAVQMAARMMKMLLKRRPIFLPSFSATMPEWNQIEN